MEQLIATYTMQGDAAKIKSGWESYARTYPNDADVLYRAGVAMHEIKDYNMASYYYQQSIGKKPTAEAYANLGSVLHAQNNDSEAIRILETAVKLNPGLQEAQQLLAALRTTNDAQVLVALPRPTTRTIIRLPSGATSSTWPRIPTTATCCRYGPGPAIPAPQHGSPNRL
ncbi:MAG: tetratricopeptide repeat protein [Vampirovibrionales bacterium]